jgi:hypothetical protein
LKIDVPVRPDSTDAADRSALTLRSRPARCRGGGATRVLLPGMMLPAGPTPPP